MNVRVLEILLRRLTYSRLVKDLLWLAEGQPKAKVADKLVGELRPA